MSYTVLKWTREEAIREVVAAVTSAEMKVRAYANGQPSRMILPVSAMLFDHRAYANDVADALAVLPFVRSAEWSWMLGDDVPSPQLTESGSAHRPGFLITLYPEGAAA